MNTDQTKKNTISVFLIKMFILCVLGVSLNLVLSHLCGVLGIPLYLDSVGTVFTAGIGGALPGILVGLLTNLIKSTEDISSIYYGTLNVMIAVVVALFAQKGLKAKHIVPLILILSVIGGVFGSILTWFLYGFATEGISAEWAAKIYDAGLSVKFLSQLSADYLIDLIDKIITVLVAFVLIKIIPSRMTSELHKYGWHQKPMNDEELATINKAKVRQISLRAKILLLVSVAVTIIAIVAIGIGYMLFRETTIRDHTEFAQGIVKYQTDCIDPEMIETYLAYGEAAPGYKETKEKLKLTFDSSDNIRFMYVYQIQENGCHVVFDMDTADVKADRVGVTIRYPVDIEKHLDDFLAGREVAPTISNDSRYGWVLSIYEPVYDRAGTCVCYSCVDISMNQLTETTHAYLAKQISLFLGIFIMVLTLGVWMADYNIIYPLNAMSHGASAFAYTSTKERDRSVERIKELDIRTGDEIENLYYAYSQTTEDSMRYLSAVRKKSKQIDKLQGGLLLVLADIIESRDKCTGDHIRKTAAYTRIILESLQKRGDYKDKITNEYISNVERAAPLHDIGKINIPDAILNKDGPLNDDEYETMKGHAEAGYHIILKAIESLDESGYLQQAKHMAHSHHEKWDGSGYPQHLKGEEIPLSARIMAVADVFDALTSRRSYKDPFPFEKAISIISEGAGRHFDPTIVEAFLAEKEEVKRVAESFGEIERDNSDD